MVEFSGTFVDLAQHVQCAALNRAYHARAVAMTARVRTAFQNTCAHPLTRHFEQSKTTDATDLNACAIDFQCIFESLFNRTIIARFIHIDEINHQKSGKVA